MFGILLVVLIFWTNITLNFMQHYIPDIALRASILIASFLSLCILSGLVGILRQSWMWKIYAWWLTLGTLLAQIAVLLLFLVADYTKTQFPNWAIPASLVIAGIVSFVLNNVLVTSAYYLRLETISCRDPKLEMTAFLWAQFFFFFVLPTIVIGALLMYYLP